jgi:hypothetical protein
MWREGEIYLQRIDNSEIMNAVLARLAPMLPRERRASQNGEARSEATRRARCAYRSCLEATLGRRPSE